ncbi:Hypothetical_protein [Hexamita inflata]|uniref:Hypothetical_protein n=1 Tax=Hexamita inflata TaxID=28002 RepID=A0ABP1HAR0_9EUKA
MILNLLIWQSSLILLIYVMHVPLTKILCVQYIIFISFCNRNKIFCTKSQKILSDFRNSIGLLDVPSILIVATVVLLGVIVPELIYWLTLVIWTFQVALFGITNIEMLKKELQLIVTNFNALKQQITVNGEKIKQQVILDTTKQLKQ